jgi:hypothetical protein
VLVAIYLVGLFSPRTALRMLLWLERDVSVKLARGRADMSVFHYDLSTQVVEIYRLLTIVEANTAWHATVNPDLAERVAKITFRVRAPEISRLVLSLAAASRTTIDALDRDVERNIVTSPEEGKVNTRHVDITDAQAVERYLRSMEQQQEYWKALKERLLEIKQQKVGALDVHLQTGDDDKPLRFREACNKVLHADTVTMAFAQMGVSAAGLIGLTGHWWGKQWRATLDLREFALAAFDVVLITDRDDRSWYDR